jgi:hypothetical protein
LIEHDPSTIIHVGGAHALQVIIRGVTWILERFPSLARML